MTRYGITGPSDPSPGAQAYVQAVLRELESSARTVCEFTSGAAYGIDTYGSLAACNLFPNALHRLVTPRAPFNSSLLEPISGYGERFEVVRAPSAPTPSQAYMARNDLVVKYLDVLLAFPRTRQEPKHPRAGGGTWATVRRARKAGREIYYFPLDSPKGP